MPSKGIYDPVRFDPVLLRGVEHALYRRLRERARSPPGGRLRGRIAAIVIINPAAAPIMRFAATVLRPTRSRPISLGPSARPARPRQGRERRAEPRQQRRRVAGDMHALVAALGAGDDRQVAPREPHSAASSRKSASLARPSSGGAPTEAFNTGVPSASRARPSIRSPRPRGVSRTATRTPPAVAERQRTESITGRPGQGRKGSAAAETSAAGSGSPARCRSRRNWAETSGSAATTVR